MQQIKDSIEKYGSQFLLLDGLVPTLTLGMIKEELILYNIPKAKYAETIAVYNAAIGQNVTENTLISQLSHGQKLMLSAIIALSSSARNILFRAFFVSLSESSREHLAQLIQSKVTEGKTIQIQDDL